MWQAVINIFKCISDIGPIFMAVALVPLFFSFFFLLRFIKAYKKFGLPLER